MEVGDAWVFWLRVRGSDAAEEWDEGAGDKDGVDMNNQRSR